MNRPNPTLTDYMVIAISPALIMAMVGSLVFYVLTVCYHGQLEAKIHYIFGLFVFASVLVARIAMEEGRAYAFMYALALGGAVVFVSMSLTNVGFPLSVGIVVLILWCTDKLMWDCTLVDASEDTTGQGLLQTAGLDIEGKQSDNAEPKKPSALNANGEGLVVAAMNKPDVALREATEKAKNWWQRIKRRPNRPGVWVIYFSIAALPIFGFGQWFVPLSARGYTFNLLCIYLASGFGLLVTTSFLGLRQYLRRRNLEMPANMAGVWLTAGAAKIALLLMFIGMLTFVIWMMPASSVGQKINDFIIKVTSRENLKSSKHAIGSDGVPDDENPQRPGTGGKDGGDEEKKSEPGDSGTKKGEGKDGQEKSDTGGSQGKDDQEKKGQGGESKSDGDKGKQNDSTQGPKDKSDGNKKDESQSGKQNGGEKKQSGGDSKDEKQQSSGKGDKSSNQGQQAKPNPPQKSPSNSPPLLSRLAPWLATLAKLIFWIVVLCIAAVFAWYFRKEVVAIWEKLVAKFRELWALLFGRKESTGTPVPIVEEDTGPPQRPFSDFADPFANGQANRMQPQELVQYCFAAFEAWARERGCPREPEQTPHEFAYEVGLAEASVAKHAQLVADLYCQVAYAPGTLNPANLQKLIGLWPQLNAARRIGVAAV